MRKYSIAVVGATGLVGRTMLKVLNERRFPVGNLLLLASKRSTGKKIRFQNKIYTVQELTAESFKGIEIALFSAGSSTSRIFAPIAAKTGTIAIDNSSEWRMAPGVPLVVPEVNPEALRNRKGKLANFIIANPNCSTIQMVVALKPLHDAYGMKRVVVSTYQSVTGAGHRGEKQLLGELAKKKVVDPIFPKKIAFNTVFHGFGMEKDYTSEEIKMINETRKIMGLPKLAITATCVRIPVTGGHGESVNVEFKQGFTIDAVRKLLKKFPGTIVQDDPATDTYPMPITAFDRDEVFVGRIRKDASVKHGLNMWVVSDNLRKGAATNAVQIAETLARMKLI